MNVLHHEYATNAYRNIYETIEYLSYCNKLHNLTNTMQKNHLLPNGLFVGFFNLHYRC